MRHPAALTVAMASLAGTIHAQTVEFFYTETSDTCEMDGIYIQANEQTTHGGVCAWRPDVERVYGCPAPDTTCWTWGQTCTSSTVGQTVCNKAGAVWCCNAVAGETCTTAEGYINICQSGFANPESGVSIDHANQVYLAAVGLSNVTATSQTADPTPFSTTNLGTTSTSATSSSPLSSSGSSTVTGSGAKPTSISTTSASSSHTTSAIQTTSGSTITGSSESSTDSTTTNTSSPAISIGAIAGIVIGALVILDLVGTTFFILGRRRNRPENTSNSLTAPVAPSSMTEYGEKDVKVAASELYGNQNGSGELRDNVVRRAEMPTDYTDVVDPNHRPRHELA